MRLYRILCGALALAVSLQAAASRSVTDETGRVVVVPDHPHRIVCLAPGVVDEVYAVGGGDDVVGISDYVKYPAEAMKKPSVGTILTPSLETVVALHPDLLLAMKTVEGAAAVEKLRQLGIPIFLVDPHGLEGIFRSVESVGDALNRKAAADAVVASLRERVARVRESVKGKGVFSVFLPIWYDPVITIGHGSFLTEMIAIAGARSVTADVSQEWPQMSVEAIVARAPQALLLRRGGRITLAMLREKPGWRSMPAVREGRVYYADERLELVSPVAIDGLEELAREFHP